MESGFIPINIDIAKRGLLDNKFDELAKWKSLSAGLDGLSNSNKTEIAKASRGFESMFIQMMMKEMKNALLDEEEEDDGFGFDILKGYTDILFAEEAAKTGRGIGIAEMLYEKLTGGEKLEPIRVINPPPKIVQTESKKSATNSEKINQVFAGSFNERINNRLENYSGIIQQASEKYDIPISLIKAVITTESAAKPDAKSHVGAKGLMQLMDSTARELGVSNSYDPYENINGGTKYLRMMLDNFDNDISLALAAYNAGPGNVNKYNGVPPFKETQSYLVKVKRYNEMFNNEEKILY